MKTTATLYDLTKSELHKLGLDEFVVNGELVAFKEEFQFIQKMMLYDEDVHTIVTKRFFNTFTFENDATDKTFKKIFLQRFMNREIGRQTLEDFATQVVYIVLTNQSYITEVMENLQRYILNESSNTSVNHSKDSNSSTSKNDSKNTDVSDARNLESDLPQNNINLDVDNTVLDYGNRNSINRNKNSGENEATTTNSGETQNNSNSETITKQYDLARLLETNGLLESIFDKIDEYCFLQIW